jgi:HAD superfamily hydrolase (TIGR01509 family)
MGAVRLLRFTPHRWLANTGPVAQLALFDLDNTLLDREKAFALWTGHFLETHGLDESFIPTIQRADDDGYSPRERFFSELRRELGIKASVEVLLADYYVEYPSRYSAEPGVLEAIRSLRAEGFKVGVVTNGPPSQRKKLQSAGIEDEFDAVCISAIVGANKPELAIFEEAARICGLPLRGWMVGDSPEADIAGGMTAGLRTIWVHRGREWSDFDFRPDFPASSIPEVVEIILQST